MRLSALIMILSLTVSACSVSDLVLDKAETVGKDVHETRQRADRDKMTAGQWQMCGTGLDIWLEALNKVPDLDKVSAILCGQNAKQLFKGARE